MHEGVTASPDSPLAAQQLCSIIGHYMKLKDPLQVRIGIDTTEEEIPVYFTDVDENLSDLDYLKRSRAVIGFGTTSLAVDDSKIPLQGRDGATQIVAAQATRIQPLFEASPCCRLTRKMQGEGLINPMPQQFLTKGMVVGRTLVPPATEEAQCMVANLSKELRLVSGGAMLGI